MKVESPQLQRAKELIVSLQLFRKKSLNAISKALKCCRYIVNVAIRRVQAEAKIPLDCYREFPAAVRWRFGWLLLADGSLVRIKP